MLSGIRKRAFKMRSQKLTNHAAERHRITPSMKQILTLISEDKTTELVRIVALLGTDSNTLKCKVHATRNQYYTRIHNLIICGLIMQNDGKYCLTSFGKVVYDFRLKFTKAVINF
jgi:predicted transcriptional regulator